jgi:hypothetical protein
MTRVHLFAHARKITFHGTTVVESCRYDDLHQPQVRLGRLVYIPDLTHIWKRSYTNYEKQWKVRRLQKTR